MATKSSAFSLIELLVVIAIIGILSATGVLTYQGYISGTKKKATENAMQQIALAQTEEFSNTGDYYYTSADTDTCSPTKDTSQAINANLFEGGEIIADKSGYHVCTVQLGTSYIVVAEEIKSAAARADACVMSMTANSVWTRNKNC